MNPILHRTRPLLSRSSLWLESATILVCPAAPHWPQTCCCRITFTAACPCLPPFSQTALHSRTILVRPAAANLPQACCQILLSDTACFLPSNLLPRTLAQHHRRPVCCRLSGSWLQACRSLQPSNAAPSSCVSTPPLRPHHARHHRLRGGPGAVARWWVSIRFLLPGQPAASCNTERFRQLLEAVCCSTKAGNGQRGHSSFTARQAISTGGRGGLLHGPERGRNGGACRRRGAR